MGASDLVRAGGTHATPEPLLSDQKSFNNVPAS